MVAHLFEKILRTRVNYSIAVTHQRRIERSVLPLTLRYRCVVEVDNETGKVEDLLNFKFRNLPKTHRVQMTRYQPDPPPHRVTRQKYCPKDRQVLNIILQPGAGLPRFLFSLKPRSRHVDYSAVALYVFKILLNVEVSKIDIKDTYSCLSPEFQMPKLPRSDSDKPFWFGVRFEERSLARKKQEILDAARKLNLGEQCHIYIVGSE
ncbi:hypothetical protein BKA69DRAFT_287255 [Paraphysoderma sedebokerense]|nr:hypothetical protein BKA69DRAFT_287255 [Paraphysoderma sedebokerense]